MKYITDFFKNIKDATQKELLRCNLYLNILQVLLIAVVITMVAF